MDSRPPVRPDVRGVVPMPLQTAPTRPDLNRRSGSDAHLAELIRGHTVTSIGRLASMSLEQFQELLASYGAKYTMRVGRGVEYIVLGEGEWPMTRSGQPLAELRRLRIGKRMDRWPGKVFTERQFL